MAMQATGMPVDIVLIRHGESEGNLAQARSKAGDEQSWTADFAKRHTSQYRLTDLGRRQAGSAANWLKENNTGSYFDRCFTSEYVRAMETAGILDLPHARWYCEFYLREMDKGVLAGQSKAQRQAHFSKEIERQKMDPFYYAPPGGESVADCWMRVESMLDVLRRSCAGLKVAIVCHGGIMRAFRVRMERMSQVEYSDKFAKDGAPRDNIRNCQIIWYTRRNPENNRVSSKYRWMKSVCPWDPASVQATSDEGWQLINRPNYTSNELLEAARAVPQLVNYAPGELITDLPILNTVGGDGNCTAVKRVAKQGDPNKPSKRVKRQDGHAGGYESDHASEDGESP